MAKDRGHAQQGRRAIVRRSVFVGAVGLLVAVTTAVGATPHAAAEDSPFRAGSGRAAAKYLKVGPSRGSLALAPTVGLALSDFLNTRGRGDVRTVDFAALEDSLPPELVSALPAVKVESTDEGAEAGRTATLGTPAEVPVGLSAARLQASASSAPRGRSSFETAPVDLGLLTVGGGRAEALSGVVDGAAREAVGTVEIGMVDIGDGALVLEGLRWEALHRSGSEPAERGSFTVGAVSVAGQRFGAPEGSEQPLADALAAAEPLLAPLGIEVTLPRARIEGGSVEMTPLRIRVAGSQLGGVVGPALEAVQPVRDPLVDAIRSGSEDVDAAILLTDVALGVLAGGSRLDVELGGATAQTADPAQGFTFGSAGGGFDLSAGSPLLGASGGLVGADVPASRSGLGSTSAAGSPGPASSPSAGTGAGGGGRSEVAADAVPASSSGADGGAGPLLLIGIAAAAAAAATGTVEYRRLLRRPPLPA